MRSCGRGGRRLGRGGRVWTLVGTLAHPPVMLLYSMLLAVIVGGMLGNAIAPSRAFAGDATVIHPVTGQEGPTPCTGGGTGSGSGSGSNCPPNSDDPNSTSRGETCPKSGGKPVVFGTGAAFEDVVDLELPGPGGLNWRQHRTYSSDVSDNTDGHIGRSWVCSENDMRLISAAVQPPPVRTIAYDPGSGSVSNPLPVFPTADPTVSSDDLYVVTSSNSGMTFKFTSDTASTGVYGSPPGSDFQLAHVSVDGEYHFRLLNTVTGEIWNFGDSSAEAGRLLGRTTRASGSGE